MDLDRFLARNGAAWDRLEAILRRTGAGGGRLSPDELDELVRLYQLVSTHLSYASTNFRSPGLVARLSRLVSGAAAVIYGTRSRTGRDLAAFFTRTLPAALWYSRRFIAASALLLLVPAVAVGVWLATSPRAWGRGSRPSAWP